MPFSEVDHHYRPGVRAARGLRQKLLATFGWRFRFGAGVYAYFENEVTGARKAQRVITGGYSPVDREWLDAVR